MAAELPLALVRAIVAAMRRLAALGALHPSHAIVNGAPIHRLRALSPLWASAIDHDAIRRSIAIRVESMTVHLLRCILQAMPVERRRRLLVEVDSVYTDDQIIVARQAFVGIVCIKIINTQACNYMFSFLPAETRVLDISHAASFELGKTSSQLGAYLSRLRNLRNLKMAGLRFQDIAAFAAHLVSIPHLHWIDLRQSNIEFSPWIVALVDSVPSLQRLDLRSTISSRERRARVREELRAALLERAEKVIF